MSESNFPPDWDEQRVKRLIQHYEELTENEEVEEDDAADNKRNSRPDFDGRDFPDNALPSD